MSISKNNKTGRWQCRFYDSAGNQMQYTSQKYFPAGITKIEAQKIELALMDSVNETLDRSQEKTIKYCIDLYLKDHATLLSGYKNIENHAKQIKALLDGELIGDISVFAREFKTDQLEDDKSASTINKRLSIIRGAATIAMEYGYTDGNTGTGIKNMPIKKGRARYLTLEEYEELIRCCDNQEARSHIIFRVKTGIRNKEMGRLRRKDIDNGRIIIDGKGDKFRSFEIGEDAIIAAENIGFESKMTYDVLRSHFNKAKREAGITDLKLHDLRHTFASWLAQGGSCSLHELQQLMGHATINMTLKYTHLMPEHLNGIATTLDAKPPELALAR